VEAHNNASELKRKLALIVLETAYGKFVKQQRKKDPVLIDDWEADGKRFRAERVKLGLEARELEEANTEQK
jgi:hypothetical protein